MKRIIAFHLIIVATLISCVSPKEENYYIPVGFEGIVTVVLLDSGVQSRNREFYVSPNGWLESGHKLTNDVVQMHFYYGSGDNKTEIVTNYSGATNFDGVQVSHFETGQGMSDDRTVTINYVRFIVSNSDSLTKWVERKVRHFPANIYRSRH